MATMTPGGFDPANLSDADFFRHVHMPFVLCEVVWDCIDSLRDVASQMRVRQIRKVMHKFADLRSDWDSRQLRMMTFSQRETIAAHVEQFQTVYHSLLNGLFYHLRHTIAEREPDLEREWVYYLAMVCNLRVLVTLQRRYAFWSRDRLEELSGRTREPFIPQHMRMVAQLLPLLEGDHCGMVADADVAWHVDKLLEGVCAAEYQGSFSEDISLTQATPALRAVSETTGVAGEVVLGSRAKAATDAKALLVAILAREFKWDVADIGKALHHTPETIGRFLDRPRSPRYGECAKRAWRYFAQDNKQPNNQS